MSALAINHRQAAIANNNNEERNLIDLPEETILHIFSYLSGDDLKQVEMTCKKFYYISNDKSLKVNAIESAIRKTFTFLYHPLRSADLKRQIESANRAGRELSVPTQINVELNKAALARNMVPIYFHRCLKLPNNKFLSDFTQSDLNLTFFEKIEHLFRFPTENQEIAKNIIEECAPFIEALSKEPNDAHQSVTTVVNKYKKLCTETLDPRTILFFSNMLQRSYSPTEQILNAICYVLKEKELLKQKTCRITKIYKTLIHTIASSFLKDPIRTWEHDKITQLNYQSLYFLNKPLFLKTTDSLFKNFTQLLSRNQNNTTIEHTINKLLPILLNFKFDNKEGCLEYISKNYSHILTRINIQFIFTILKKIKHSWDDQCHQIVNNLSSSIHAVTILPLFNHDNFSHVVNFVRHILNHSPEFKEWVDSPFFTHRIEEVSITGRELSQFFNTLPNEHKTSLVNIFELLLKKFPKTFMPYLKSTSLAKKYNINSLGKERIKALIDIAHDQLGNSKEIYLLKSRTNLASYEPNEIETQLLNIREEDAILYFQSPEKFNNFINLEMIKTMFEKALSSHKAYKSLNAIVEHFFRFKIQIEEKLSLTEKDLEDLAKKLIDHHGYLAHRYFKRFCNDNEDKIKDLYHYLLDTSPERVRKILGKSNGHLDIFNNNLTTPENKEEISNKIKGLNKRKAERVDNLTPKAKRRKIN